MVLTPEGIGVDQERTTECRETLRRERGRIGWTFDRGVEGREA